MKKLYKTIDGEIFNSEQKALSYENKLKELALKKVEILEEKLIKIKINNELLVKVGKSFDEAGNSKNSDLLQGTKEELIKYISLNKKYWFYNNCEITVLDEVINLKKELES